MITENEIKYMQGLSIIEMSVYIAENQIFDDIDSDWSTFTGALSIPALHTSMLKCRKGVMWKSSVVAYVQHSLENISKLHDKLEENTYHPRLPIEFFVTSPKLRTIVAICFQDRVILRSLIDNIIYPMMTRSFIDTNCACQKGKGTDFGRNYVKKYLYRQYKKNNSNDFYYLQIDIHQYYQSMRHDILEELFKEKFESYAFKFAIKDLYANLYSFIVMCLNAHYKGDIGYNPGSLLIQIGGISFLNKFDHWVKEELHCKAYVRYVDDIVILDDNKEILEEKLQKIILEFEKVGFTINPKKTKIQHIKHKLDFLGFIFSVTNTGKIIVTARREVIKRDYKHWRNIYKAIISNKYPLLDSEKLIDNIQSTIKYLDKGNCWKLQQKIIGIQKQYKEELEWLKK